MEEEAFQVRVRTLYEIIYKDGSRKVFNTREELLNEISQSLKKQGEANPIEAGPEYIESSKRKLDSVLRHLRNLPKGYEEVFSEPSEKWSHKDSVYRYAHNAKLDAWGYVVSNGKTSPFHKLGSLSDRTSHLSRMYNLLSKDKGMSKTEIYKFNWNGEFGKAVLDVLLYLDKIEKKTVMNPNGRRLMKVVYTKKLVEDREVVNSRGLEATTTPLPASQ